MKNSSILGLGAALIGLLATSPAWAFGTAMAYHYDNTISNATVVAVDSKVPPNQATLDFADGRVWYYTEAFSASNNFMQVGVCEGKNLGVYFKDYYFSYCNSSGTPFYTKISNAGSYNESASFQIQRSGSGTNWYGVVSDSTGSHSSSTYNTGYSTFYAVDVSVASSGCSRSGSNFDPLHPFSNMWVYSGSWNRVSNSTSAGTNNYCATSTFIYPSSSGSLNGGGTAYCKTYLF